MTENPKSPITRVRFNEPENDVEFERLTLAVAKIVYRSDSFELYGRSGQKQHGIDIQGHEDSNTTKPVVLQSKCIDPRKGYESGSIREHVEMAVEKGLAFKKFVWATTLPRSTDMQDEAKAVQQELAKNGYPPDTEVIIWSWGEFTDFAHERQDIRRLIQGRFDDHEYSQSAIEIDDDNSRNEILSVGPEEANKFALIAQVAGDYASGGRLAPLWEMLTKQTLRRPTTTLQMIQETLSQESNLSDVDLSRANGLIGNCCLALTNFPEAAKAYEDAYALTPHRTATIANYGTALGLQERFDEFRAFASTHLSKAGTEHTQLASVTLHFLKDISIIPERYRTADKVLIEILEQDRSSNNIDITISELRALRNRAPDNNRAREALASALLDRVITDRNGISSEDLGEDRREDIRESEAIYRELWKESTTEDHEDFVLDISIPHNYAVALRVNGRVAEAQEVLSKAFRLRPDSHPLALQYGICLLETESSVPENVLNLLDEGLDALRVKMKHHLNENNWDDTLKYISKVEAILPEGERGLYDGIKYIAEVSRLSGKEQKTTLDKALATKTEDVRELLMLAQLARKFSQHKQEQLLYDRAVQAFSETCSFESRIALAHEARHHEDFDSIFQLLEEHIDYERDSEQLRLLCEVAASEFPTRERDERVFDALGKELKSLPRFRYYEAVYLENAGKNESARRVWSEALKERPDLRSWLGLWRTSAKLGDKKRQEHLTSRNDLLELEGNLSDRMELAHILWFSNQIEEGARVAEETIRSPGALSSPDVTARFSVFFLGRENVVVEQSDLVKVGTYVELKSDNGSELDGVIGARTDYRWGNAISIENHIVKAALGKRRGDTFQIDGTFDSVTWTVNEAQPELIRIIQFVPSVHEMDFGSDALIFSRKMPNDNDVSGILSMVRRQGAQRDNLIKTIIDRNIPICFAADANQSGPLSIASAIENSNHDFPTSNGVSSVFDMALSVAKNCQDGVVVDSVTLQTALRTGMLETLAAHYGPLRVPSLPMREMRERLEQLRLSTGEQMSLSAQGEQVYRDILTPEDVQIAISQIEENLHYISQHCKIETVVFSDTEDEALLHLMSTSPITASLISLAKKYEIPIMSEDRNLRDWVKGLAQQEGFWLNPALRVLRDEGEISKSDFVTALADFSYLHHRHLSLSGEILCDAFDMSRNELSDEFRQLCNELGGDNADISSHANVAAYVIEHVLENNGRQNVGKQAASHLLNCILKGAYEDRFKYFVVETYMRCNNVGRTYIAEYMTGHFYLPIFSKTSDGADT